MPRIRPWLILTIIAVGVGAYLVATNLGPTSQQGTVNLGEERAATATPASNQPILTTFLTVAGRVLSNDGKPIENAKVSCFSMGPGYGSDTTGAQGTFCVTNPPPGKYSVTVTHGKYASAEIESVYVDDQDPFKWLEITLPRGAFIRGTVTDDEGGPVSAFITIESLNQVVRGVLHGGWTDWGPIKVSHGWGSGSADSEGRYSTAALCPGAYKVTARHRGCYDAEPNIVKLAAGEERLNIDLVLKKKRAFISGKVTDTEGNPLADAGVTIEASDPDYVNETLKTNVDGAFSLQEIAAARYRVTASAEGYLDERLKVTAPADSVLIKLRRGGTIKGRVVDKTTGEPIDNFVAHLAPYFSPSEAYDEGGSFEYGRLRTDLYSLCVGAPGYAKTTVHGIRVREGAETNGVLVELQPVEVATVVFRVTSARDGSPIEGASVSWNEPMEIGEGETETDAEGQCSLEGVGPGLHKFAVRGPGNVVGGFFAESEDFGFGSDESPDSVPDKVTVRSRGFGWKEVAVLVTAGERRKQVEVALEPTFTLRGRVVSKADGRPIWCATVQLRNQTDEGWEPEYKSPVETDRQGTFVFDEVMPGRCMFRVWHEDYVLTDTELRITEALAEDLIIEIPAGAHIFGTVLDPDGAPVVYAIVGAAGSEARTDEAGNYSLSHVAPGQQRVYLSIEDADAGLPCEPRDVLVNDGDSVRVDFHLVHGATVTGKLSSRGEPLEDAKLELRSEKTPVFYAYATTGEGGHYRFEPLLPGAYTMDVKLDEREHGHHATYHRRVEIGQGEVTLDIELGGSSISGVVLGSDGNPLPRAHVSLKPHAKHADRLGVLFSVHETGFRAYTRADGDGVFSFGSVPGGSYRLVAGGYGHAAKVLPLEVPAEADVSDLKLGLEQGLAVQARVRTYDDAPPPALVCYVLDEDSVSLYSSWLEPDSTAGTFTIGGFSSGRFLVFAMPYLPIPPGPEARYAPDVREVSVTPAQEAVLEFHLKEAHQLNALVLDESGKELEDALVVLDPGGEATLARVLNDYVFFNDSLRQPDTPVSERGITLYGIPDSDYTLHVRAQGYQDASVPVRIAGSDEKVTVTLKPRKVQPE